MSKKNSTMQSIKYSVEGAKEAFSKEPNMRIHAAAGSLALLIGLAVGLNKYEWLFLSFVIVFVFILEFINTSLEAIVDIVSPDYHPRAKVAKDVAAAAVLLASVQAIVVGAILFIPKLLELLGQ